MWTQAQRQGEGARQMLDLYKAVFEQEQNAKQATAKQATESSAAERAELETLAGTTEAAQSMWPELKPTYGVFTESSDSKNPHRRGGGGNPF